MGKEWIWTDTIETADRYAEFKTTFYRTKGRTVLNVSADSEYAVFINGKFVYAGQYADFPWYKIYDKIEITPYLTAGENECVVWAWYCGDTNFCHYVNRPAVWFEIADGDTVLAKSGADTLSRPLPYYVNGRKKLMTEQIGYTFSLDLTQEAAPFFRSVVVGGMPTELVERPVPLLTILPKINAKKISDTVYDLGRETVGFPFIKMKTARGSALTVAFGEWLDDRGKVPRRMGERDFSFSVMGNGEEKEIFNPLRKLGCRYFEIDGEAEIEEIGLIPQEYPFKENTYETGNMLRKKIYEVAVRTLKLNALEHYYDCPWREQAFYALDSRMQMRYGYVAFKNTEYPYAALKLMSEDRNAEGLVSIVVPTSHTLVIPSFSLFYVIAMEEYAEASGDLRLIGEYFEKMQAIVSVFLRNLKNGLLHNFKGADFWNFYEWNAGLDGSPYECDSALNLTFLLQLKSLIKICKMLRKPEQATAYEGLYRQIAEMINAEFYDGEKGLYRFGKEDERFYALVNAYAVLTGVADGQKSEDICRKLVEKDESRIECTLSMQAFVYDALLLTDEGKYARYVLEDIDEKYAYMLANGATAFWETLKGAKDFDGAGSLCHGWSALPVYYYQKLIGRKGEKQ